MPTSRRMIPQPGYLFERRFSNQVDSLHRVIEDLSQFLEQNGVPAAPANLARLVVEEMVTNILKYGYDDTARHDIRLGVNIGPGSLLVVLEDDGHAFDPLEAPTPDLDLPIEEREPGGLGIHLVRKLASEIEYQRRNGLNCLRVKIAT